MSPTQFFVDDSSFQFGYTKQDLFKCLETFEEELGVDATICPFTLK